MGSDFLKPQEYESMNIKNKIGWKTASGLVIANMIGTGVFTSLGFQVLDSQNTWSIIILWVIGGMMALVGAFVYAELGTHFKQSGGDYIFLSRTIHPTAGYLYAWVSLTVGFSAPISIAAMAMVEYWEPLIGFHNSRSIGMAAILMMGLFHSFSVNQSGLVHNILTGIKLLFVFVIIGLGFGYASVLSESSFDFSSSWKGEILAPGFAVSLIYVFYAYTGWNSAAYIVEEIKEPRKSLPKALISAAFLVMVVYVLLQLVFLKHASIEQLQGKVQVATLAFGNLFGPNGALWVSFFIGIQLIATISGYAWVGPRVTYAMAKDFKLWKPLSKVNVHGIPTRAIILNTFISLVLFSTGSFEQVMLYAGFVLQLMGTVTVYSSLRIKKEQGFRTPYKPVLQVIYLIFSTAVMGYLVYDRPMESLAGLGILGLGGLMYALDKREVSH